ncbi:hypothetical protein C1752_08470 [Acaryochloris thomasi RCC1774]|uniref:Carboxypeptidase regulatory-like domain-containing protein n=1 Tax=Acaryochloris thomasi RCC1774 TaxID=1764569 RepID=A0A2W1JAK2_9CYAN|nr:hypothetical protein [Acaryochloris thomasi]PZD71028.1 hypothetical protein C1752_08470 [Acaryochloris thomasi RCC1774]
MKAKLFLPLTLLAVLGISGKTLAHVIETDYLLPTPIAPDGVTGSVSRSAIKFTAKFSSGEPYPNAKVTIYAPDDQEKPWRVMQANEEGEFEFQPDQSKPGEWTVDIGEGSHWDSWTVPVMSTGGSITYGELSDASSHLPSIPPQLLVIGAACVSGSVGAVALRSRRRR